MTVPVIIFIVILAIVLLYLFLSYFLAGTVIYLNSQPLSKNLRDYSMDFENIEFPTSGS
jgi:hypothetical protein